jgi:hypothetical protein
MRQLRVQHKVLWLCAQLADQCTAPTSTFEFCEKAPFYSILKCQQGNLKLGFSP